MTGSGKANGKRVETQRITTPFFRDHRTYVEAVVGMANSALTHPEEPCVPEQEEKLEMPPMDSTFSDFTLNVSENCIMSDKLERAVLVEYEGNVDAKQAVSLAVATDIPFVSASSVSPFKLLLFFDSVDEMMTAIAEDSPLRTVFTRVSRWEDGGEYYERIVLVECVGIHPKCWAPDKIKRIGERWGSILHIDTLVYNWNGSRGAVRFWLKKSVMGMV